MGFCNDTINSKPFSSIIPFASGFPITLETSSNKNPGTSSFIGFGTSATGLPKINNTINITNLAGTKTNFAFSIPRPITIKSISAFFSTTSTLSLIDTFVTVKATLYNSNYKDNNFFPITETSVSLTPVLTSVVLMGHICNGAKNGLNISIDANTRLMLVFSAEATGISLKNTINGYASSGIEIL